MARLGRGEFHGGLLRRLPDGVLGGDSARPLLSSLVETIGERDRELLGELERMVQAKKRGARRRP